MTEREELEYAAKAFILRLNANWKFVNDGRMYASITFYIEGEPTIIRWNPREDDGDCGRLEAALDIDIAWYDDGGFVVAQKEVVAKGYEFTLEQIIDYKDHNNDKQKARKHAVTRLAAEIGKAIGK